MFTRAIDRYTKEIGESIASTCKLLGVSRQVYYRSKRSTLKGQQRAFEVVNLVMDERKQLPRIGTRKLYYKLQEPLQELHVGRDKLFSIIKANHLEIKPKRSYHVTTNSHHRFHKHKNLIINMDICRPEQVWVSDITYIGSRNNHSYLALVTDAYSKKIVGYDLSDSLGTEGSIRALKMAVRKRVYKKETLIHHSDRGFQYCSEEYQKILSKNQIITSMTESYDPYANAVAERVNGILKDEFQIEKYSLNRNDMCTLIKNSIEKYNSIRPHYSCYMLTPEQMHLQNKTKIRTYKKNKYLQG